MRVKKPTFVLFVEKIDELFDRTFPIALVGVLLVEGGVQVRRHWAEIDAHNKWLFAAVIGILSLCIVLFLVLRYLTTGRISILNAAAEMEQRHFRRSMEAQLEELRASIIPLASNLPEGAKPSLGKLKAELSEEITRQITKTFRKEAVEQGHISLCRNLFKSDDERLRDQINKLRWRSNLNLAFGVGTTLVAMGVLW